MQIIWDIRQFTDLGELFDPIKGTVDFATII